MANEISISANLQATKSNLIIPKVGGTKQVDMAGAGGGVPGIMDATNAAQGVNVTSVGITTLGWCFIKNLDPAAVVDYGTVNAGTLYVFGTLKPAEQAVFRLKAGITWAVKSSIASSKVQILILDD